MADAFDEDATVVVGLGLIGGSLARALLAAGKSVRGLTRSDTDRALASAAGIAVLTAPRAVRDALRTAAVVVFAVPLDRMAEAVAAALADVRRDAVLLHTGSLQRREALGLDGESYARVVGTHPLAGAASGGFGASSAALFRGATVSLEERSDARLRAAAEALWRIAGASGFDYRSAEEHDRLMSWASHLPQLASTALAAALADAEQPLPCGPGARDTTRLAASPPEVWQAILAAAPPDTIAALAALERHVATLRRSLSERRWDEMRRVWERARTWRQQLDVPP